MKIARWLILVCAVLLTALAGSQLTLDQARERAAALRAEIARHDELYFKRAAPEITDAQYDSLKRELGILTAKFPELTAETAVGDDRVPGFPRYRHRVPMLSLNKTHTEAELKAFIARVNAQLKRDDLTYVIEPKYDGLGISVTYEKGKLARAATRGDGTEGDDVTANLTRLTGLPRQLAVGRKAIPEIVELRGEVYMGYAEFKRINQEREAGGEEPFAHPRNLAVGTLKQEMSDASLRRLEVVFYGIGAMSPAASAPRTQQELHGFIKAWGLPGVHEFRAVRTPEEAWSAIQLLGSQRSALPFPMDGAVVKLDDFQLSSSLGATAEAPRGTIAYKYPPDLVATRLAGIVWQVGRTGVVSPVAELDPVKIGGTTIHRATLHNGAEIARLDLRIGDWVYLEKAGEIIPAITGVDLNRRPVAAAPYQFPEVCPACTGNLVADGAAMRCANHDCEAQVQRRLEHFVSNGAVDINGLGKVTIAALIKRGWVKEPADLYALRKEQLRDVTSEKTADKVVQAIATSKTRELWRFIHGLSVPEVGPAAAKAIAMQFPDLSAWIKAREEDYRVGRISAGARQASLVYFADEDNRRAAEALYEALSSHDPAPESVMLNEVKNPRARR
jgi:DNA ligase (NAD+)